MALHVKDSIADGGQNAAVFSVQESDEIALKVFFEPDAQVRERITSMVAYSDASAWAYDKALGIRAAWPIAAIREPNGVVAGFVMPLLSKHRDLFELSEPDGAMDTHSGFSWRHLLRACRHLATTVVGFHERGIVIGDVSPHNVLIDASGFARLIDCDSFGYRDHQNGREYPSYGFTEDYTAPERLSGAQSSASIASDRFSLALVITQALSGNISPFVATPAQVAAGEGMLTNLRTGSPTTLEESAPAFLGVRSRIPVDLLRLSRQALQRGAMSEAMRPSAATWMSALSEALEKEQVCAVSPWHGYCLPTRSCPWCRRAESTPTSAGISAVKSSASVAAKPAAAPSRRTFGRWLRDLWEG